MGNAIISRRGGSGGGLSQYGAVLRITAEVGSIITLQKGGILITLRQNKGHVHSDDSTLADWYYSVSTVNFGEWTVTATKGIDTASVTVEVSELVQYDVFVTYDLYIVRNGIYDADTFGTIGQYKGNLTAIEQYNGPGIDWVYLNGPASADMAGSICKLSAGTYSNLVLTVVDEKTISGNVFGLSKSSTSLSAANVVATEDLGAHTEEGAMTWVCDISGKQLVDLYVIFRVSGSSGTCFLKIDQLYLTNRSVTV